MTVNEAKIRIEKELAEMAAGFGNASALVKYDVQISENEIEGAPTDVTYIFGSLSLGAEDAPEEDRLYLPLDAELDDDDNIDEAKFEENLADFKAKVEPIRDRLSASENPREELATIIAEFDREMDEKYRAEIERLNAVAKKNLIWAGIVAAVAVVGAIIIMVADKLA